MDYFTYSICRWSWVIIIKIKNMKIKVSVVNKVVSGTRGENIPRYPPRLISAVWASGTGNDATNGFANIIIREYSDSAYTTQTNAWSFSYATTSGVYANIPATETQFTVQMDYSVILNSSRYYKLHLQVDINGSGSITYYGGNGSFPQAQKYDGGGSYDFVNFQNLYFILDTTTTPTAQNTTSRIDSIVASTTARTATITGYWNATSTAGISEGLIFYQETPQWGQTNYAEFLATTTGNFTITVPFTGIQSQTYGTSTATSTGDFQLVTKLYQFNTAYYDPFGTEGLDQSLYKTLLDSELLYIENFQSYTPTGVESTYFGDVPEYECSILQLGGCLRNTGVWLFYPNPASVEQFKSLTEDVKTRFPFRYAYEIGTFRQELFNSTQTATSTVGVSIRDMDFEFISKAKLEAVPFANTIKIILGFLLWLMAIEYIYYKVIKIHDNETKI